MTAKSSDVRVIAVSSISGLMFPPPQGIDLDHVKSSAADVAAISRYGQSKLAMILAMRHLATMYPDISFSSLCPGNVKTNIWEKTDGLNWFINTLLSPLVLLLTGISVEQAVRLPMWCATAPRDESSGTEGVKSGTFYHPGPGQAKEDNKFLKDDDLPRRLWNWTNDELSLHGGSSKWPSPF